MPKFLIRRQRIYINQHRWVGVIAPAFTSRTPMLSVTWLMNIIRTTAFSSIVAPVSNIGLFFFLVWHQVIINVYCR